MARPVLLIYERVVKTPPAIPTVNKPEVIRVSASPAPGPNTKKQVIEFPTNSPSSVPFSQEKITEIKTLLEELDPMKKNDTQKEKKIVIKCLLDNLTLLEKILKLLDHNIKGILLNTIHMNEVNNTNTEINLETMKRLLIGKAYLNDVAINAGMFLIHNFKKNGKKNALLFNTYLTLKMQDKTQKNPYDKCKKWSRKISKENLNTFDVVIFPFNIPNSHWLFIAVDFKNSKILNYDSLYECNVANVDLVKKYLKDEEESYHWTDTTTYKKGSLDEFKLKNEPSSKQRDSYSCGEFVYRNIETLVFNLYPSILDNTKMDYYYHLHALELLKGELMLNEFESANFDLDTIQDDIIEHLEIVYNKFLKKAEDKFEKIYKNDEITEISDDEEEESKDDEILIGENEV